MYRSDRGESWMADGRTVPWLIDRWATYSPDRPFLIWEPFDELGRTWTYGEFARDVAALGGGLIERGVGPGDRLLLHMDNCPEFVLTWFACASIGAVAVCTNTKSSKAELEYFAQHAATVAAVTQPDFAHDVEGLAANLRWVAVSGETSNDMAPFGTLFGDPNLVDNPLQVGCSAPVSIQYTSGTTARPKAVVWTHANALFGAKVSATHEGLRGDDVHLIHLPLFHTNAQMYSMLATVWCGATAVLQPRFSASRFWDVAIRNRCTFSSVVPFCAKALATQGDPPAHHFRRWASGVSRPPEDDLLGVTTMGWFGMTETVTHCTVDDHEHPGRRGGMGRPAPEYGVRLVDDDRRPVPVGETGHLEVLGVPGLSLFAEYLNDPIATAASYTADGWFITGDLARANPDGYLTFVGRQKDMLKVGGENVAAAEVEAVIAGIAGVAEAAVVAKPHEMLNEVPVAFVIANSPSEELGALILSACREQLAKFKVPAEVRFVEELPRSALNKVAKGKLRADLAAENQSSSVATNP